MIRIYCGKPGSGKSVEIKKDIEKAISDTDNTVMIMHGLCDKDRSICLGNDNVVEKNCISAKDIRGLAEAAIALKKINPDSMCYLFIDNGIAFNKANHKELSEALILADEAGVKITMTVQKFSSIKNFAPDFFKTNCDYYIVHKNKSPRIAKDEDFVKYA